MSRVQKHQSEELQAMTSETDYPGKIKSLLEDVRVMKDQNKSLKAQLYEENRKAREVHGKFVDLESTVRELKQTNQRLKVQQRQQNKVSLF